MKSAADHARRVQAVLRDVRDRSVGGLRELAKVAFLSPFHFQRIFKQKTGLSPAQHVRNVRLIRAAIALRTTGKRIIEIALAAQYKNHESFSRAFRRQFGCSPAAYRKKNRSVRGVAMKAFHPAVTLIKIPVTDFKRACEYYRDVLGFEEEFAVEAYGWAQYKAGEMPLCLYTVGMGGGNGKPGGETNFHLAVDDAGQAFKLLKSRGARLPCELVNSDDGGSFFMVADPDGNCFKVVQRR